MSFLDLWWKECRCRLALEDVSTAELTTGSLYLGPFPNPQTQLEGTEWQVLPVQDWLRYEQPCDPPDDPEWPTPRNAQQLIALLDGLAPKQQMICALVAAELVLSIFEERYPSDERPRRAIETAYRWVEGQATREEVRAAAELAQETAARMADAVQMFTDMVATAPSLTTLSVAQTQAHNSILYVALAAENAVAATIYAALASTFSSTVYEAIEFASSAFINAARAANFETSGQAWENFHELWWKECRCRLAFMDAPTAELTTGQPPYYEGLKERLEQPSPTVLPQSRYERHLTPCDPPDDPSWPAPENFNDVWDLLAGLPLKQQVICALTAAELVLPIFEEVQPGIESPKDAIAAGWQWVRGTLDREQVMVAATAAEAAGGDIQWEGALGKSAGHSAFAASLAAESAGDSLESVADDAWATMNAMEAAKDYWGMSKEDFYAWWWRECRCRLALEDVASAELTTGHPAGTTGQPPTEESGIPSPKAFYYGQLKRSLESPSAEIVPVHSERYYQPCNPPEDAKWPTPQSSQDVLPLLARLPLPQRVVSALVAYSMVAPTLLEDDHGAWATQAKHAVETISAWVDGNGDTRALGRAETEMRGVVDAINYRVHINHPEANPAPSWAAKVLEDILGSINYEGERAPGRRVSYAIFSAANALITAEAPGGDKETVDQIANAFYRQWWTETRCVLAFSDVGEAELTTGHPARTVGEPPSGPESIREVRELFDTLSATEVLLAAEAAASVLWAVLKAVWIEDPATEDLQDMIERTLNWALETAPAPDQFELNDLISMFEWMVNTGKESQEMVSEPKNILLFDGILAWLQTVKEGLYGERNAFLKYAVDTVLFLFTYGKASGRADIAEQWWRLVRETEELRFVNEDLVVGHLPYTKFQRQVDKLRPEEVGSQEEFFTASEQGMQDRRPRD